MINELPDYRNMTPDDLTVPQERALFGAWCDVFTAARDNGDMTTSEFLAARWDLESWYMWIAVERDKPYIEAERRARGEMVQTEMFAANATA